MNKETLGNIRKLRERAGLSQLDVAEKLNISQSAYSKIEKGTTKLNEYYLHLLPGILGCEITDIVSADYFKNYTVPDLPLKNVTQENIDPEKEALREQIQILKSQLADKEKIIRLLESQK